MRKETQADERHWPWIGTFAVCICLLLALTLAGSVTTFAGEGEPQVKERVGSFELLTPDKLPSNGPVGKAAGETLAGEGAETDTYIPLVLIVIGFEEQPYNDTYDWADSLFRNEWSVAKYYTDMSCGKFTFVPVEETSAFGVAGNTNTADTANDGVIHVTLPRKKTQGWNVAVGNVFSAAEEEANAYHDAIVLAADYIDFGAYDSNGDGTIQTNELGLGFVVSGLDAAEMTETSQSYAQNLLFWPNAYSLSAFKAEFTTRDMPNPPTVDGVVVDDYIAIAESYPKGSTLRQAGIGTLAHELGHYLGLPDLYSTDTSSGAWWQYKVNNMSLMDQGSYGEDLEGNYRPYSLDIWSRVQLGWVTPKVIPYDQMTDTYAKVAGSLSDGSDGALAVRINTYREGEYFLVENRRFTSWDEGMSLEFTDAVNTAEDAEDLGGGFIIWHVDEKMYKKYASLNTVNSASHHPAVMPVYAEVVKNEDEEESVLDTIGGDVLLSRPFFTKSLWTQSFVKLPLYGSKANDLRMDRLLSSSLLLKIETKKNAPVMEFHLHRFEKLRVSWVGTERVHLIGQPCTVCNFTVSVEITDDITSEVTKRPTQTEPGIRTYTAHFVTDNRLETYEEEIPIGTVLPDDPEDPENPEDPEDPEPGDQPTASDAWKEKVDVLFEKLGGLAEKVSELRGKSRAETVKAVQTLLSETKETLKSLKEVLAEASEMSGKYKNDAAELLELAERKANVLLEKLAGILADSGKISIEKDVEVAGESSVVYTGKPITQSFVLTKNGKTLQKNVDYTVGYEDNIEVGTATVVFTGAGKYKGLLVRNFSIVKAKNTLAVKAKAVKLSAPDLKKAAKILARADVLTVSKAKGTVSYAIEKAAPAAYAKYFVIGKSSGRLKAQKGLKAGTYKLKVKVTAAGTENYKKGSKSVVVTVTVK